MAIYTRKSNGGDKDWLKSDNSTPGSINDTIYTEGNVGIGVPVPTAQFETSLNAKINGIDVGSVNGTTNTLLGDGALANLTTALNTVAIGSTALTSLTSGFNNVGIGRGALDSITIGGSNIGIGVFAGSSLVSSSSNIMIGNSSMGSAVGAGNSIAIGISSLQFNNQGNNLSIGSSSTRNMTTGQRNVVLGHSSMREVTTGFDNTVIGNNNARNILDLTKSTVIGSGIVLPDGLTNVIVLGDGSGNQRLYIDSSGNAHIGGDTPVQKLDVEGAIKIGTTTVASPGSIRYNSVTGNGEIYNGVTASWEVINGVQPDTRVWQDVSASRATQTTYQNTTGRTIEVSIRYRDSATARSFFVGTDPVYSNNVVVITFPSGTPTSTNSVSIPPDHYYGVNGNGTILLWAELS